jgi:hypothetical protein
MMLTDLADICRKAGMATSEVEGWRTRGHGQMQQPETIVCHHTAGPATGNMPSLNTLIHGRSDLPGPLCHLGLGRDGTVYVVAAGLAYHAGDVRQTTMGNAYAIGIEAEGTGVSPWPAVQMDAYAQLCRALCDAYGIPIARVLGHKEVCAPVGRKTDPNFDMSALRRATTNREDDMTPEEMLDATVKSAGDRHLGVVLGQTWAKVSRIEAALSALAVGLGPTVEQAVKQALAEGVVDVDVTVTQKGA